VAYHLKRDKQIAVVKMLVEGCSIRSVERITGVHRDTIMRLGIRVGQHCASIMDEHLRRVSCDEIQIDELWGFVGKKQRRVRPDDPYEFGDAYTFIAIDPLSKLVLHHETGKRDEQTTRVFMQELSARIRGHIHISVDGFGPYPAAIRTFFSNRADATPIVKAYRAVTDDEHRYSPPFVTACRRHWIQGFPRRDKSSTSHIERMNLTSRMQLRRLTRLTNGFSKRLENLKAALSMTFCWYNFVRIHGSLRMTPAMSAGIASGFWDVEKLLPPD
jgi:IS1 family transposase